MTKGGWTTKTEVLSFRVSPALAKQVWEKAKDNHLTVQDYIIKQLDVSPDGSRILPHHGVTEEISEEEYVKSVTDHMYCRNCGTKMSLLTYDAYKSKCHNRPEVEIKKEYDEAFFDTWVCPECGFDDRWDNYGFGVEV